MLKKILTWINHNRKVLSASDLRAGNLIKYLIAGHAALLYLLNTAVL